MTINYKSTETKENKNFEGEVISRSEFKTYNIGRYEATFETIKDEDGSSVKLIHIKASMGDKYAPHITANFNCFTNEFEGFNIYYKQQEKITYEEAIEIGKGYAEAADVVKLLKENMYNLF